MSITIPPKFEKFIREKVSGERYASAIEVVVEALELLEQHERLKAQQRSELEAKLIEGVEQLERGETFTCDQAYRRLMGRLGQRRQTDHA